LIQRLASLYGKELIVQNLSLQTDSSDLLGGYKPLELRQLARKVYVECMDLFMCTFSRAQNAELLIFMDSALEKGL
jgi:midasin